MTEECNGQVLHTHRTESEKDRDGEYRWAYERDRDRLLYSSAFRRLAGVTQVTSVRERHLLHNRLTHSLKVAQMGRRMTQRLLRLEDDFQSGLDEYCHKSLPDIVETAGLAHDLGHPPFGHIAEEVLAEEMKELGGFEGNAQTFRIVTKLAVRDGALGLNLTRAALNGILKYPQFRSQVPETGQATGHPWHDRSRGVKWGAYDRDQNEFHSAREGSPEYQRSTAAIIMDWADDISYATHDIHDYFRAGLVPLAHLASGQDEERFLKSAKKRAQKLEQFDFAKFESAYDCLKSVMPSSSFNDTRDDRVELSRTMTVLIAKFAGAISPTPDGGPPYVTIDPAAQYEVEVMKHLTHFYVIERPSLKAAQFGQKRIILELFRMLQEPKAPTPVLLAEIEKGISLYEEQHYGRPSDDSERRARATCDYLCALTEDQALDLYERITGLSVSRSSIFDAWFS